MSLNTPSPKTTQPVFWVADHQGMALSIQKGERHVLDIHVDYGGGSNLHDPRYVCCVVQGIEHRLYGCGGYGTDVGDRFGNA